MKDIYSTLSHEIILRNKKVSPCGCGLCANGFIEVRTGQNACHFFLKKTKTITLFKEIGTENVSTETLIGILIVEAYKA